MPQTLSSWPQTANARTKLVNELMEPAACLWYGRLLARSPLTRAGCLVRMWGINSAPERHLSCGAGSGLAGAALVSNPCCLNSSSVALETPWQLGRLYNWIIAARLRQVRAKPTKAWLDWRLTGIPDPHSRLTADPRSGDARRSVNLCLTETDAATDSGCSPADCCSVPSLHLS